MSLLICTLRAHVSQLYLPPIDDYNSKQVLLLQPSLVPMTLFETLILSFNWLYQLYPMLGTFCICHGNKLRQICIPTIKTRSVYPTIRTRSSICICILFLNTDQADIIIVYSCDVGQNGTPR